MPYYNYYCKRCDANYGDLRKYEERNKKLTCPECGKRQCPLTYDCSKNADGRTSSVSIRVEGGTPKFYHSVGVGNKKHEEDWLQGEIDNTKKVLKDANKGGSPYADKHIDFEHFAKEGVMKKVSRKKAKERLDASNTISKTAAPNLTEKDYEYMGNNKKKD